MRMPATVAILEIDGRDENMKIVGQAGREEMMIEEE